MRTFEQAASCGPSRATPTGVLRSLDVSRSISRADKVNTLGFCIGGSLALLSAAPDAALVRQMMAG